MRFCLPVELTLNNHHYSGFMGPFEHSTEREFAMAVNRRAIDECSSLDQMKSLAKNLLEGWSMMNTALQGLMMENIQLRQALAMRDGSLEAADAMLSEAAEVLQKYEKQSKKARRSLWPFGR